VATYTEYDRFMSTVEQDVTRMHDAVNELHEAQEQLSTILAGLSADARLADVRRDGTALLEQLKGWDSDMVSRKTRAYDDAENFAQKFTANWLFMINATESDLPRVNQSSRDRLAELEPEWAQLKARAEAMRNNIEALNRTLFNQGIGAIRTKKAAGPRNIG
jgi:DNA repair exonuclease SbcCD ATPase subunit